MALIKNDALLNEELDPALVILTLSSDFISLKKYPVKYMVAIKNKQKKKPKKNGRQLVPRNLDFLLCQKVTSV